MLHLNTGVHLDEVVLALDVVEDEFDGARILVAHLFAQVDGCLLEARAELAVNRRRRRFLDELLVAALRGAIALAERDGVLAIRQHLDFDVADVGEVALDVHGRVVERGLRLVHDLVEVLLQSVLGLHHAHAAPAATSGCLNQQREASLLGDV